jgi:hypothetical protein
LPGFIEIRICHLCLQLYGSVAWVCRDEDLVTWACKGDDLVTGACKGENLSFGACRGEDLVTCDCRDEDLSCVLAEVRICYLGL